MDENWQTRLRRLGVVKGTRHLPPPPVKGTPPPPTPADLTFRPPELGEPDDPPPLPLLLPGGRVQETAVGGCFLVDRLYPLTYRHGADQLGDLVQLPVTAVAHMTQDTRFHQPAGDQPISRRWLFLDTETTGLAGAGVMAFMVGVAFFEGDALVVRQFFLRDHGDEAAMLTLLNELSADKTAIVTFNGRSFDLPLLDGRYLLNRLSSPLFDLPHFDLLSPARRLWRTRLGSCALGSLEQSLLGVRRTQEDVPGWFIPSLYQDYLRTGDARELLRVFYHNQLDMLSMVTLAARVLHLFDQTAAEPHPVDRLSLSRWQADLGLWERAEQNLRQAIAADLPLAHYHEALLALAALLKRQGRRAEAVLLWQQAAVTSLDSVTAHIELAKHYEWQQRDLATACRWTEQAVALIRHWSPEPAALVRPELEHRLARLRQKMGNG